MLTRPFINTWLKDGTLVPVVPRVAGDPIGRALLVSKEINAFLSGPWDDRAAERKANRLQTDLEQFVIDAWITVCMVPRRAKSAYMAVLDTPEDGVWDIRSRDPKPAIRIVGCFAEVDVFVGLTWDYRINLTTELQWKQIINRCQSQWRTLFPAIKPHTGEKVHEFISRNVLLEGD